MAQSWFTKVNGVEAGPFSSSGLKGEAQGGRITPDSLVRRGDDGEWVPAQRIQGLFEAVPAIARTAPPPLAKAKPLPVEVKEPEPVAVESSAVAVESLPDIADVELPAVEFLASKAASSSGLPSGSPLNMIACPDCEEQISRRARECPHCGCAEMVSNSSSEPPTKPSTPKRYQAIQVFSWICRALALICLAAGLIATMAALGRGDIALALLEMAAAAILALICFFQGELLSAIVDIEQNTRRTGDLVDALIDAVWNQ